MLGPIHLRCGVVVDEAELRWRFSRAGGPGGQSVNTADSRVELTVDLAVLPPDLRDRATARLGSRVVDGAVTVTAAEHRSQLRNREAAMARMTTLLDDALSPPDPPRRPTRPSRSSRTRRTEAERRRRQIKSLRRRPPPD